MEAKNYVKTTTRKKSHRDKRKHLTLHRLLTDFKWGMVDHKDGDPLNNRKTNLRKATPAQNAGNTKLLRNNKSGYKGVFWDKKYNRW